jgi:hypothetical protein
MSLDFLLFEKFLLHRRIIMKKITIVSALALVAASASNYTLGFGTTSNSDLASTQSNVNRGLDSDNRFNGGFDGRVGAMDQGAMTSNTRGLARYGANARGGNADRSAMTNLMGNASVTGTQLGGSMTPSVMLAPNTSAAQSGMNMSDQFAGGATGASVLGSQFNVGSGTMRDVENMRSGAYDSSAMRDAIDNSKIKTVTTTTLSTANADESYNNSDSNTVQG